MPKNSLIRSSKKSNTRTYIIIIAIILIVVRVYFVITSRLETRLGPIGTKPVKPAIPTEPTEEEPELQPTGPETCTSGICDIGDYQSSCTITCSKGVKPSCDCVDGVPQ